MKKYLRIFLFFLILTPSWGQSSLSWIAASFDNEIILNRDVLNFIEVTQFGDQETKSLFLKANKNYKKFKKLKHAWLSKRFNSGLKQLLYFRLIEKEATKGPPTQWKAFTVSKRELQDELKRIEVLALKTQKKKGLNSKNARKEFAKQLIRSNWPDYKGQKYLELYQGWLKLQKRRVKEKIRIREVQRYESYQIAKHLRSPTFGPKALHQFGKKNSSIIKSKIHYKKLSKKELSAILKNSPELSVLIKNIEVLSLGKMGLLELKQKSSKVYKDSLHIIRKKLIPLASEKKVRKIIHYEKLARDFAKKYKNPDTLKKLYQDSIEKFLIKNNDYNQLMLSKLYKLAIAYKKNPQHDQKQFKKYAQQLVKTFKRTLSDHEVLLHKKYKKVKLADLINQELNERKKRLLEDRIKQVYLNQSLNMAIWSLKFEVKKAALLQKPMIKVHQYNYKKHEGQVRIQRHLNYTLYQKNLKRYRTEVFAKNWKRRVKINPDGKTSLSEQKVWNYLFE